MSKMDTTFSTAISIRTNVSMGKLYEKFSRQINLIKCRAVDQSVLGAVLGGYRHFPRLLNHHHEVVINLIMEWMETILYVKSKCDTPELLKMFEDKIPHLTSFSIMIADHPNASITSSFKHKFFTQWSKFLAGTSVEIRRKTVENDIKAMTTLCEAVLTTGHYLTQLQGLKVILKYIGTCESDMEALLKKIIPSDEFKKIRDLLLVFDFKHFDTESRKFLNELNMNILEEPAVYSVAVKCGFVGKVPILKPLDKGNELDLWVDLNRQNGSVSFFCNSTTFNEKSNQPWVYVEILPRRISIDRTKHEFRVFSNKQIQVEPPAEYGIFSRQRHVFRFTCNKEALESLMPLQVLNKEIFDANGSTSADSSLHKTIISDQHDDVISNPSNRDPLRRPDMSSLHEISEREERAQNKKEHSLEKGHTSNSTPIKDKSAIFTNSPPVSSIHNNLNSKSRSVTPEIVMLTNNKPKNHSKVEMLKKNNTENAQIMGKTSTSSKKSRVLPSGSQSQNIEANKLPKRNAITKGKKRTTQKEKLLASDKENDKILTPEPLRDITNFPSSISKYQITLSESVAKSQLKSVSNLSLKNSRNSERNARDVSENQCLSVDTKNESGKQKTKLNKQKNVVKAVSVLVKEIDVKLQPVSQKLDSREIAKTPLVGYSSSLISKQNQIETTGPSSASKRKLFTDISAFEQQPSQSSKDTQIQRRNYIQERRNRESKGSLKLVNLVKPLEFNDKSGERNGNKSENKNKFPITGNNEEEIRNTIEEYVSNRGYVGIKNALNDQTRVSQLTLQERKIVNNNLEKINSIVERTTHRFFKAKDQPLKRPSDIYDVRNAVAEDPKTVKKGNRGKNVAVAKKHKVEKYIGENKTATFSYRRNKNTRLGYMEKEVIVDISDSDVTKPVTDEAKSKTISCTKKKVTKPAKKVIEKKPRVKPIRQSLPRAKKPTNFKIDSENSEHNSADGTVRSITVAARQETRRTFDHLREVSIDNIENEVTQPFIYENCTQETLKKIEENQNRSSFMQKQGVDIIIHNYKATTIDSEHEEGAKQNNDTLTRKVDNENCSVGNPCKTSSAFGVESKVSSSNEWIMNRYFQSIEKERGFRGEEPTNEEEGQVDYCEGENENESVSKYSQNGNDISASDDHVSKDEGLTEFGDDNVDLDSYNSEQNNLGQRENSGKSYSGQSDYTDDYQSDNEIHLTYTLMASATQTNFGNQEHAIAEVNVQKRNIDVTGATQVVPYKRARTESVDTEFTNIEHLLILNFEKDVENIFNNIWNDQVKSSASDVQTLMINVLESFLQQYVQKIDQVKVTLQKMEELSTQMKREQANLLTDTHSAHKLLKKLCLDVSEVKSIYSIPNSSYESAVNTLSREATVSMKQHWKEYVDKVAQLCVETIKKHNNFDVN